jgi:uncharacterized integral membrane protein
MLSTIFLIFALVLFILAAVNVPSAHVNLTAAGLAFMVASMLVPALH